MLRDNDALELLLAGAVTPSEAGARAALEAQFLFTDGQNKVNNGQAVCGCGGRLRVS